MTSSMAQFSGFSVVKVCLRTRTLQNSYYSDSLYPAAYCLLEFKRPHPTAAEPYPEPQKRQPFASVQPEGAAVAAALRTMARPNRESQASGFGVSWFPCRVRCFFRDLQHGFAALALVSELRRREVAAAQIMRPRNCCAADAGYRHHHAHCQCRCRNYRYSTASLTATPTATMLHPQPQPLRCRCRCYDDNYY